MSEIQHAQTVASEQEYLLTKEAFHIWVFNIPDEIFNSMNSFSEDVFRCAYLKEHGLPADSEIEGL